MGMSGRRGAKRLLLVAGAAAAILASTLVPTSSAEAITGADFDPGFIISDLQFYDNAAMSESQIQAFLDGVIGGYGGCATSNCLAQFKMDTFTRPADRTVCAEYVGGSQESAARIIFKVQSACGISARVLLVTLQKEQSLLTTRAPSSWQMTASMGYGCPDTAPCDAQFYGFYNQMYKAAWQFKRYSTPDRWGSYQPGSNYIQYNPNPDCGGSWVNIRNNATAALYNYTPYQPNAASLSNLYGSGGTCGAHGNRNFWTYYHGWFGDPENNAIPGVSIFRVNPENRWDSSAMISAAGHPGTVPVVYIATGDAFPDALSAGAAAARDGGPVLLVNSAIQPSVHAELVRLKPQRIVVVGGPNSIPESVITLLKQYTPNVTRVAGENRFAVSRQLLQAQYAAGPLSEIYVAAGADFPDALGASYAAGYRRVPVLLVNGAAESLDSETLALLAQYPPAKITIVGGPASVSTGVQASLSSIAPTTRIDGANRYAVSANLVRSLFPGTKPASLYLATGETYPDALAGSVLAVRKNAAMLVTQGACVSSSAMSVIKDFKSTSVTLLGGPISLNANVRYLIGC